MAINTVLQLLSQEAEAVEQFAALLQTEHEFLKKNEVDCLSDLAESKARLATQLNQLSLNRGKWLQAQGYTADRDGFEAWCHANPQEEHVLTAWGKVLTTAAKARDLNRLNGELIEIRMQYTSQALDILRRGQNTLDLYGPDGKSALANARRISDSA